MKNDSTFPKPVAKINKGKILVFLEKDIIQYEQNHQELTDEDYKEWYQKKYCYRKKEYWNRLLDLVIYKHYHDLQVGLVKQSKFIIFLRKATILTSNELRLELKLE